jgi:hypothetical protein
MSLKAFVQEVLAESMKPDTGDAFADAGNLLMSLGLAEHVTTELLSSLYSAMKSEYGD